MSSSTESTAEKNHITKTTEEGSQDESVQEANDSVSVKPFEQTNRSLTELNFEDVCLCMNEGKKKRSELLNSSNMIDTKNEFVAKLLLDEKRSRSFELIPKFNAIFKNQVYLFFFIIFCF